MTGGREGGKGAMGIAGEAAGVVKRRLRGGSKDKSHKSLHSMEALRRKFLSLIKGCQLE